MEVEQRKTRWNDNLVTSILEIPPLDEDTKSVLFYNKTDYLDFQEKEQRRYDKMMAKQIQKMVYDAMGPQLQQAMDRGATPEEIEAMMPQTTEEIFQLLGGLPNLAMPAQLRAAPMETLHKSNTDAVTTTNNEEHKDGEEVSMDDDTGDSPNTTVHASPMENGFSSPTMERQSDCGIAEVTPDRQWNDSHGTPNTDMVLDMSLHENTETNFLEVSSASAVSIQAGN